MLGRLPKPWTVEDRGDLYVVMDATGRVLVCINHREDLHKSGYTHAENYLSKEEAKTLADAIAQIPTGHGPQ